MKTLSALRGRATGRRLFSTSPSIPPSNAWADCLDAAGLAAARAPETHVVINQVPALEDYNAAHDPSLRDALTAAGCEWAEGSVDALGTSVGSNEWQAEARAANDNKPTLRTHDNRGRHIDVVDYHPSYHSLMKLSAESGVTSLPWDADGRLSTSPGAMTARGALHYLMYQLECGVCCPMTMTFAATPAFAAANTPLLADAWLPKLITKSYDPRDVPIDEKAGVTVGMSMTEKQGGSDVRANTTLATAVHPSSCSSGDQFTLRGHKWFTSAPMSDAFLTLAHTPEGVSCFVVPRWLPDGTRNSGYTPTRTQPPVLTPRL